MEEKTISKQEMSISKRYSFDASHRVLSQKRLPKLCHNLHGHTYSVTVTLFATKLNDEDMILDYGYLDDAVKPLINTLDHSYLYGDLDDVAFLEHLKKDNLRCNYIEGQSPTAENISSFIAKQVYINLIVKNTDLCNHITAINIVVQETPNTTASVTIDLKS